jgi:hypothetical protein
MPLLDPYGALRYGEISGRVLGSCSIHTMSSTGSSTAIHTTVLAALPTPREPVPMAHGYGFPPQNLNRKYSKR